MNIVRRIAGITATLALTSSLWSMHAQDLGIGFSPEARFTEIDGKLYGTTSTGGPNNAGTVFRMNLDGSDPEPLATFPSPLGRRPYARVIQGPGGALYGTTYSGGCHVTAGTVFKVNLDGTGFTTLHDFSGPDGDGPLTGVLLGADQALYGVTVAGGDFGYGTLFKLESNGANFSVLHHFTHAQGTESRAELCEGPDGVIYGTTHMGGSDGDEKGTVFRFDPSLSTEQFRVIYDFDDTDDGHPAAGVILGTDGWLYGTEYGDPFSVPQTYGAIFRLTTDGTVKETLHEFAYPDGAWPISELAEDADGLLYGTAGLWSGTVFTWDPNAADGESQFNRLHAFDGSPVVGVRYPQDGVTLGTDGMLYGTTILGGTQGLGAGFRLPKDGLGLEVILSFDAHVIQEDPVPGNLVADAGEDFSANEGQLVMLDGSGSSVANGTHLNYSWEQVSGKEVTLSDVSTAQPTFTAPLAALGETLTFELTVCACNECLTDVVVVDVVDAWSNEGCALAGITGDPLLIGTGDLVSGSLGSLDLSNAAPSAPCTLFIALSSKPVEFKGGLLKPFPFVLGFLLNTTSTGTSSVPFIAPALPAGTTLWAQFAIQDAAAIAGVSLSNAVVGTTP